MGGGGSNEVQETEYERAAAEVAGKYWGVYNDELKQFEDTFIQRVDNFNSDSNMNDAKASVDMGYNKAFSESREATAQGLSSAGVDPTSGKFKTAMSELSTEQGVAQSDTINRAQASEQDKYIAGLSDVVAMGMGEQADSLRAVGDVANMSLNEAKQDAYTDFNKRSSNMQFAGAAAGVGLRSYTEMASKQSMPKMVDGTSTSGSKYYDPNFNPNGYALS
ncbi:hypothetical protein [Enterovibrio sp. 27052020O]|uniref:hypothetical protein n=1 Tax=Enterovibrio sp. 27052020O TaxID=3241166 RepID=UPI00388D338D